VLRVLKKHKNKKRRKKRISGKWGKLEFSWVIGIQLMNDNWNNIWLICNDIVNS
jgi:predicted N-acyltransferase